jgi:hypothetical protein
MHQHLVLAIGSSVNDKQQDTQGFASGPSFYGYLSAHANTGSAIFALCVAFGHDRVCMAWGLLVAHPRWGKALYKEKA